MGPVIHSLLDAKTKTERESAEREKVSEKKCSQNIPQFVYFFLWTQTKMKVTKVLRETKNLWRHFKNILLKDQCSVNIYQTIKAVHVVPLKDGRSTVNTTSFGFFPSGNKMFKSDRNIRGHHLGDSRDVEFSAVLLCVLLFTENSFLLDAASFECS